jgi:hypothetical protein
MTLAEIVNKLRKVKYGDYVLSDDNNNLVDAITYTSKYMKTDVFSSDKLYKFYDPATELGTKVWTSIYSKQLGSCLIDPFYASFYVTARGWVNVNGQIGLLYIGFTYNEHPVGEQITVVPETLPDMVWVRIHYYTMGKYLPFYQTTPVEDYADMNNWCSWDDVIMQKNVYLTIWASTYVRFLNQPFTFYVDKIRSKSFLISVSEF